jgi:hypothetical protein
MAVVTAFGESSNRPNSGNLQTSQTGNADSTNTIDTGAGARPCTLKIVSTVGATPTVTVNILGSADGTNFFNIPYSTTAAPTSVVVAALTITTAVTSHYHLTPNYGWRYLKLNMSANTNVTLTSDLFVY